MKQTWLIMGMPINVVIEDKPAAQAAAFKKVHDYFRYIDDKYSPYKPDSEVSAINNGLPESEWSEEMKTVIELCRQTKDQTHGYFDVFHKGRFDPSGLVKGWAINNAAQLLGQADFQNFYIEAGGDVQVSGHGSNGEPWTVGIRNPFNRKEVVKVVNVTSEGVATSGTYIRGQHIYNPITKASKIAGVASLTVIGPDIYEADRFATAAFAMGKRAIGFIENLPGYEAYMITSDKQATLTTGFEHYTEKTS